MNPRTKPLLLAALLALAFGAIVLATWRSGSQESPGALAMEPTAEEPAPGGVVPLVESTPILEGLEHVESVGAPSDSASTDSRRSAVPEASDNDLLVEIVDFTGRPVAGLPLVISVDAPPPELREVRELGLPLAFTDDDGRATFPKGKLRVLDDRSSPTRHLWHFVAFEELPRIALTEAVFAQDVVRSVQPPYGSLEVHVVELDGTQAENLATVRIQLVLREETNDPNLARDRPAFHTTEIEAGRAHFPFVEPDRAWVAAALRQDTDFFSQGSGPGPIVPGTSARIEVRMGSDRPVVRLRLIDEAGRALAERSVSIRVTSDFEPGDSVEYITDESGVVLVEIKGEFFWFMTPEMLIECEGQEGEKLEACLDSFSQLEPGLNDHGDVTLLRQRPIVSGRVVDEHGVPFEGASVAFGPDVRYDLSGESYHFGTDATVRATSAQDGSFQISGIPWQGQRFVWAYHTKLFSDNSGNDVPGQAEAIELETLGQRVELVLREAKQPVVTLLVPQGLETSTSLEWVRNDLRLEVFASDDPERKLDSQMAMGTGGQIDHFYEHVSIGRFDVTCHLQGQLIGEVRGVSITEQAHLATFDLASVLRVHRLRLIRPPGDRTEEEIGGDFLMRIPGQESSEAAQHSWRGDVVEVLSLSSAVDLHLLPERYREIEVEGLSGEREVHLRAPLEVRLVLITDGPIPADPYVFDPDPQFEGHSIGSAVGSRWYTKEKRESVFLLPRAGKLTVAWHFEKRLHNGAIGGHALHGREVEIEVLDVPGEQRIELHLPAAALRELVENPPF